MIRVENIDVYGFQHAIRAMRNPMNSWDKSDSVFLGHRYCDDDKTWNMAQVCEIVPVIKENDLGLMQRLFKAGTEHRTYARMIYVWMDITAPLYWWKEMDRYTVGKSQVSTSTMHKIHAKEFTLDDFSHEHLVIGDLDYDADLMIADGLHSLQSTINTLNKFRLAYLETKDKDMWWNMIQLLPTSYNQKRTICMSYEVVFKIIKERTGHKLDEWNSFVEILRDLPYVKEMMGETE